MQKQSLLCISATIRLRYLLMLISCFVINSHLLQAQQLPLNKYGLAVLTTTQQYRQLVNADSNQRMVNLETLIPGIRKKVHYATRHNFTRHQLYTRAQIWLRLPAAKALQKVQTSLAAKGLGLLVFDAYRPYRVTEKMWEIVPDDRYAADPGKGSGHNRGIAIDLTLVWRQNGKQVPMPTGFDDFTERAHQDYTPVDTIQAHYRQILRTAMEQQGFKQLTTEWWHFYLPDYQQYPLMDLTFDELR